MGNKCNGITCGCKQCNNQSNQEENGTIADERTESQDIRIAGDDSEDEGDKEIEDDDNNEDNDGDSDPENEDRADET